MSTSSGLHTFPSLWQCLVLRVCRVARDLAPGYRFTDINQRHRFKYLLLISSYPQHLTGCVVMEYSSSGVAREFAVAHGAGRRCCWLGLNPWIGMVRTLNGELFHTGLWPILLWPECPFILFLKNTSKLNGQCTGLFQTRRHLNFGQGRGAPRPNCWGPG